MWWNPGGEVANCETAIISHEPCYCNGIACHGKS